MERGARNEIGQCWESKSQERGGGGIGRRSKGEGCNEGMCVNFGDDFEGRRGKE